MIKKLELSVLDQTPVRRGSNASAALQESVQLAKLADQLGYKRYWLSEHHNTIMLAGAAPEVMIARLAAETTNIRLGSGGIMLPNHSTLKMAENFKLLEALYPGRIDMGIGRAPGGDRYTAQLLNPSNSFDPQEYVRQITDLKSFLSDEPSASNGHGKVRAIPKIDTQPDIWMLTSSGESAYLAAHFGLALSFAQFINPIGGAEAIANYTKNFKPSAQFKEPVSNVGIFAFCSEDEQKVKETQAMMDYRFLSFEKGKYEEYFSYDEIKDYEYSDYELQRVQFNRERMIIGSPAFVKMQFLNLAEEMNTSEIVVATFTEDFEDRLKSYKLMADMFN